MSTSNAGLFDSFVSTVATLTAVVVVPTPPLAPTNAKTGPPATGARCPSSRVIAASNSACFSGWTTYSLTPARIPSSISAGSSAAASSTTLVAGC
jgi:hypothetical protein